MPVIVGAGLILQIPLKSAVEHSNVENAQKHGVLMEVISALDTVKSLGAESKMQREWEEFFGVSAETGARVKFFSGLGIHVSVLVQQIVIILTVIVGVHLIADNTLTVGGLRSPAPF